MNTLAKKLKRAHKSWTLRVNAAAELLLEIIPYAAVHFPELEAYVPPGAFTNIMRALLIANIILRFKTTKALEDK